MITARSKQHKDAVVTEEVLRRAIRTGARTRRGEVRASGLEVILRPRWALVLSFEDQTSLLLPMSMFPEFSRLKPSQLQKITLGFAGSAIILEDADIHVSVAGLIKQSRCLRHLIAVVGASMLGSSKSQAKASSARINGGKGGRPRKEGIGPAQ